MAEVPATVVTVVSTVPAGPAGAAAVIWVTESSEKLAAGVLPKSTALGSRRLVPVMVTDVSPQVDPEEGLRDVMVGAAS
jgi:hypothetical protein